MRRIEARRKNAKAFRLRHSQSLAKRRQLCVPKTLNPSVMVMKSAQDGT